MIARLGKRVDRDAMVLLLAQKYGSWRSIQIFLAKADKTTSRTDVHSFRSKHRRCQRNAISALNLLSASGLAHSFLGRRGTLVTRMLLKRGPVVPDGLQTPLMASKPHACLSGQIKTVY